MRCKLNVNVINFFFLFNLIISFFYFFVPDFFLEENKNSKEKSEIDLNTILDIKNISSYLKDINPECLKNRLCCGFLLKKGEKNIMNYRQRWFLLISAQPLVFFLIILFELNEKLFF